MRLRECLEVSMCSPLETGGQWLAMVVRMPVSKGSEHKSNKMVYNLSEKNKEILQMIVYLPQVQLICSYYLFMIWDPQVFSFSISLKWTVAIVGIPSILCLFALGSELRRPQVHKPYLPIGAKLMKFLDLYGNWTWFYQNKYTIILLKLSLYLL